MKNRTDKPLLSEADVAEHDGRFRGVMRRAFDEHGWTPVEDRTPLDALLAKEVEFEAHGDAPDEEWAWPDEANCKVRLSALKREEALEVASVARRELVWWIAGAGLHPFRLVQRFYALCNRGYPSLLGPLNGEWLAEILTGSRQDFHALMSAVFGDVAEARLGVAVKTGGQKSAESSEKYAANAKKHCPKRQLNGDAGVSSERRQAGAMKWSRAERERIAEARKRAKQRDLLRAAAEFEQMVAKGGAKDE